MEFLTEWLIVAGISLVAVMSPGPDFVLAVRNSFVYSRKTGVFTAIGIGLGVCVHITYCIIGIAAVISQSIMLFNLIRYAGAAYLIYIGWHALRSKGFSAPGDVAGGAHKQDISTLKALRTGFITNALNPKATMFFLALFTQVIDPHTPFIVQIIYGLSVAVIATTWFSFVAVVLTHKPVRNKFLGYAKWIDRICGGLMMALGLRIALARVTS